MYINYNEEAFELKKYFEKDETLVWIGKPGLKVVFNRYDYFMIPFSIFWCGFAFFWEFFAIVGGAPFFFAIFGLPFVLVGLYLVFGRFYFDVLRRKKILYVLTNKRIIISYGTKNKTLKTAYLETFKSVILKENSNQTGTISFIIDSFDKDYEHITGFKNFIEGKSYTLEMIDDAAEVYKKINRLINKLM